MAVYSIRKGLLLNGKIGFKRLQSQNFAEVIDLLGGTGVLNVDGFDGVQFDLRNPNQIVGEGDKYKYNYNLFADVISGYASALFKYSKIDFYLSGNVSNTTYQREGLYETENFPGDLSYGKGEKLSSVVR